MLLSHLPAILCVVLALCSIYATLLAVQARSECHRCYEWIEKNNKNSVTLKRIAELETEMTECVDAVEAYGASLKKLRSRVGMRKVRDDRANGSGEPDSTTDPEGWKRWKRAQLHIKQIKG